MLCACSSRLAADVTEAMIRFSPSKSPCFANPAGTVISIERSLGCLHISFICANSQVAFDCSSSYAGALGRSAL